MKQLTWALLVLAFASCKTSLFTMAGERDGVAVSYRWNHPPGKPVELLLKLSNQSPVAQQVHVALDLSFQAFTVEQFLADTCIPAGRTFNGKLNGIYFIPRELTPEQAASPDTRVQLAAFQITAQDQCP